MRLPRLRARTRNGSGGEPSRVGRIASLALALCLVATGWSLAMPVRQANARASGSDADDAALLLSLINAEREERSLPLLEMDDGLSKIAESHAMDMIESGYFGHVSPTHGTLAARFHNAGVYPAKFAENLAGHTSLEDAHKMLMGSPAHKGNILSGDFAEVGIAVVHGGPYGMMIVEVFAAPYELEASQTLEAPKALAEPQAEATPQADAKRTE